MEYSRFPGQNLRRKMLTALKLQMHTMLISTAYNSQHIVVLNLHKCMTETAKKMLAYVQNVTKDETRMSKTIIGIVPINVLARFLTPETGIIRDLTDLALAIMKSHRNRLRSKDYQCTIGRDLLQWFETLRLLTTMTIF